MLGIAKYNRAPDDPYSIIFLLGTFSVNALKVRNEREEMLRSVPGPAGVYVMQPLPFVVLPPSASFIATAWVKIVFVVRHCCNSCITLRIVDVPEVCEGQKYCARAICMD
jgi:hypothetical protein